MFNVSNVGRGGRSSDGDRPPARRPGPSRFWWILGIVVLILIIFPSLLSGMITDWMWFGSQNIADVYTTRLWLAVGVFFVSGILAAIFCWVNWAVASRASRPGTTYPGQREPVARGLISLLRVGLALAAGIIMGLVAAGEWPTILLFVNRVPFGQTDPLFHNDVGYYVFALPFYVFLRGWLLGLVVIAAIGVAIIYLLGPVGQLISVSAQAEIPFVGRNRPARFTFNLDRGMNTHLSVLGGLFLLLLAAGYWLGRYNLLYSTRSVAYGAGYADVHARLPGLNIMLVVAVVTALLLFANIWARTWKLLAGAVGAWLLALVLVTGLYPWFVQNVQVKPSEFSLEQPYIQNNIAATRAAYGLDKFREREVPAIDSITQQQVAANQNIVQNIRLWDYRPLLDTFAQIQEFKQYYSFSEVDIDRYTVGGQLRQVMLSAREMSTDKLATPVKTWQNQHFVYTHGYGAVVSPVNEIAGEGLPSLWVKDIPPVTIKPELTITRPEIYYGEQTNEYVFVGGTADEFDHPASGQPGSQQDAYTKYTGKGGVQISNFMTKILFALRFGDANILLTDYITPSTRVLFYRNFHDAVDLIAPFLTYDQDPYLVISDGRLYWIQDAFTTSAAYPYSTPYQDQLNYIRNSVKVVIDAYNGTINYYVADPTDPIVNAYRGIFPSMFKDLSAMPAGLRAHLRYPEDMLNIQAHMFATYHMTDPQVFYNKEDLWNVPFGSQSETSAPLQAYYVNLQLPGDKGEGFMLILPFTPATRDNMSAWMAARSDGADYGKVDVIRYPKQQLVYGPAQIDARINQDPLISQQLTLWNQSGSKVIRGNLLTIPISNSVLYVEPLFLQATGGGNFPELKRVIVATGSSVGLGSDLQDALNVAFKVAPGQVVGAGNAAPGPTPVPGQTPIAGTPADLTRSALDHYSRAQEALRTGDWATYGREQTAMKNDLDNLARLTGAVTPVPTAGATPAATPSP